MRFLHTSDWHLGRQLYGRRRHDEFARFLEWLEGILAERKIDVLLVAGDIFDTSTPGTKTQELYYGFLHRAAALGCRHMVITGGNHDSPSFLSAPGPLLKAMNIHVIGSSDISKELLVLDNKALVCAVPYLRDREIRRVEPGESADDKSRNLLTAIEQHYSDILQQAKERQRELEADSGHKIPLVVMGHLFTSGGKTTADDGVRELYVGSLAQVGSNMFGQDTDYLALGHLHVPQLVDNNPCRRYSGSPLPMGFGEAGQKKGVVLVDFNEDFEQTGICSPEVIPVPSFQSLEKITGDLGEITAAVEMLKMAGRSIWVEVEYRGEEGAGNLRNRLDELVEGSMIEILRIKNPMAVNRILKAEREQESLDDLNENLVFERCLDSYGKKDRERADLLRSYGEILELVREGDPL
jgi:exonuclease SbcD